MGSHAICPRLRSPNTLFSVCMFSPKQWPKDSNIGPIWDHFWVKSWHLRKKRRQNASKKGCPSESNAYLFPCQGAPGEAASRAHCSDKKQLFEQQLKHCSKFLLKKWTGFGNVAEKVNWTWNKNCMGCWKAVDACCQKLSKRWNECWRTILVIWHALGQGPANFPYLWPI